MAWAAIHMVFAWLAAFLQLDERFQEGQRQLLTSGQ